MIGRFGAVVVIFNTLPVPALGGKDDKQAVIDKNFTLSKQARISFRVAI